MSDATAIVVLGMHRSGTSALAGVLHQLGAGVPDDLMPGDQFNEKGYWESQSIADLDDEIFKSVGWTWDKIGKFPEDWFASPAAVDFRVRAIELLARHFGKFPLFVLKDPRFSILVPFWVSVLEEMGVRPVFVITSRNPAEVAGSLAHRDRFPIEKTELLWLMHTLAAEKSTRGKPRVFIDYAQLLDNWKDCAARIGKALGVEWPTSIDAAAPKIDAMLCPDLRHQCAAGDELTSTSAWVSRTYEAIRAATDPLVVAWIEMQTAGRYEQKNDLPEALQLGPNVGRVLVTQVRIFLQSSADNRLEYRGKIGIEADRLHRMAAQDSRRDDRGVFAPKGRNSGRHLVKNDAKGKQIRACVQFLGAHLLGRHVGYGSEHRPGAGAGEIFFGDVMRGASMFGAR